MACTHILIPTDFSEPAHRALRYALEEATVHHANVTLLHVLPAHTGTDVYFITGGPGARPDCEPALERRFGTSTPPQPRVVLQDHHEAALTQLRDLMPASFEGSWDVDVAAGSPAETIVHMAHERGADLIVMGTHGRTGLHHMLLGSVAEDIYRNTQHTPGRSRRYGNTSASAHRRWQPVYDRDVTAVPDTSAG